MQRKKWISGLCIAMAAALVFTGCGHKKSSREEKGTTVSSGTVVMMVGDDQVRYSEVMAYCYFLKCQYEDSFGKELWQYKLDDNETIGDQAKQEIVNMITQLKVISDVAQQQEVSLSADEQDEALRQAESLVQKLPGELQAVVCGMPRRPTKRNTVFLSRRSVRSIRRICWQKRCFMLRQMKQIPM